MTRDVLSERQRCKLVKRARLGDGAAFGQLVRDCTPTLYRVCLGAAGGREDMAAEAVQEALVSAWKSIDSLEEPRYFKTWITRICLNACTDLMRRERPSAPLDEHAETAADPALPAEAALASDAGFRELVEAAGPDNGAVIALYYGEGYRTDEIAEMLNVAPATVRQRLSRGRRAIAAALEAPASSDAPPTPATRPEPRRPRNGRTDDPRGPNARRAAACPLRRPSL